VASSVIYALLAWQSLIQLISVYTLLRSANDGADGFVGLEAAPLPARSAAFVRNSRREGGLFYVVVAPTVMALVALLGSDRFGLIGGVIGLCAGADSVRIRSQPQARRGP